jgi:hypothetical protein
MTEAEVILRIRKHLESQFPMVCLVCRRPYASFREFLRVTKPVGSTISYDAELNSWTPMQPLGTVTCANCTCGNTLSLSSEGMPLEQLWHLMNWARSETKKRGLSVEQLLNHLREEMRKEVLGEGDPAIGGW